MGEIVSINIAAKRRDETLEQAWERFVSLQRRSQSTLELTDGIAAGRAYREFLELCARLN